MPSPDILEFAKMLVQQVRDQAIQSSDLAFQSNAKYPAAKRWKESMRSDSPEVFARMIIADIVDETITSLLQAIDQSELNLSFVSSKGMVVDLNKDGRGELTGWYTGAHGWREMFSSERYVDDFADLDPKSP